MISKSPAKKRASASQTPQPPFFGTLQEWQDFLTAVEAMKPSAKREELLILAKDEIGRISRGERYKPVSMFERWKMDSENGWGPGIEAAD